MSKTTQDGADDDVVHCLFRWSQVAYDPSQGDIINGDKLRRDATNAHAELSRLRTENEAMREALREIAFGNYTEFSEDSVSSHGLLQIVGQMQDIARAALQEPSNG